MSSVWGAFRQRLEESQNPQGLGELARELDARTIQTPALDLIDKELMRLVKTPGGRLIISVPPQEGKLMADDTPVPTPEGWKRHGDLTAGDLVFHPSGRTIRVLEVHSPSMASVEVTVGKRETFLVHPRHEWKVFDHRLREWRVVETLDMMRPGLLSDGRVRGRNRFSVPPHASLILPRATLHLAPHSLGVWLRGGNPVFANPQGRGRHIPTSFLRASVKQRQELLDSLTEGEDTVTDSDRDYLEDVAELACTLGHRADIRKEKGSWRLIISHPNAVVQGADPGPHFITKVAYSKAPKPGRCITVDAEDGMYLVGRTFTPTHNSSRAARVFPIWCLKRSRDMRVVIASYGQDLARKHGKFIRNAIRMNPQLNLRIQPGSASVSDWNLDGGKGGVLSVGIGTGLTGNPADCVAGNVLIDCEHGTIRADEAYARGIEVILAYDHDAGMAQWRRVEASRRIERRRVIEIITRMGRTLSCTPDHRIHTGRGYLPARELRAGDTLVTVPTRPGVPVRSLVSDAEGLRKKVRNQADHDVLLGRMYEVRHSGSTPGQVLSLRSADPEKPEGVLLESLHPQQENSTQGYVSTVQRAVPAKVESKPLLLEGVRQPGSLREDARGRELSSPERHQHVSIDGLSATAHPGTGWESMRMLRNKSDYSLPAQRKGSESIRPRCSPHQRSGYGQSPRELDHPMLGLPWETPQVEADSVSMVRHLGDREVAVYDFQVEGTHNFFAGGVLVHNCLIIDDPLKDRKEADSPVYRDGVWDWWTDTASTRLGPGAPVCLILTRWSEDDLAGRLLQSEDKHRWRVLNIPAQAYSDDDPLGRKPGEFLISARGRTRAEWEDIKKRVGARTWASLYQGQPAPPEGAILKRSDFQFYNRRLWITRPDGANIVPDYEDILMSCDLAFKDLESSDYVVLQIWIRRGANCFLLDQVRGRFSFSETCRQIRMLSAKWPQVLLKLVEDKANGPAVISSLSQLIPGIVPEEPNGSKVSRVSAVSPLFEAKNVWLPAPEIYPWISDYIEELASFPSGKNDDQIDATSQALHRLIIAPLLQQKLITEEELEEELSFTISPY